MTVTRHRRRFPSRPRRRVQNSAYRPALLFLSFVSGHRKAVRRPELFHAEWIAQRSAVSFGASPPAGSLFESREAPSDGLGSRHPQSDPLAPGFNRVPHLWQRRFFARSGSGNAITQTPAQLAFETRPPYATAAHGTYYSLLVSSGRILTGARQKILFISSCAFRRRQAQICRRWRRPACGGPFPAGRGSLAATLFHYRD